MTETLRLAIISPHHPSESTWGLTHTLSVLCQRMARLGHDVSVYYPTKGRTPPAPDTWEGIRAIPVPWFRAGWLPFGPDLEFSWRVARRLPRELDVVVAHNENGGVFAMRRTRRLRRRDGGRGPIAVQAFHGLGIRFLQTGRAKRPDRVRPRLGYYSDWIALRALEGGGARNADACVACSAAIGAEIQQQYGVPPGRIRVIYNGVDPQPTPTAAERAAARRSLGLADSVRALAFLGQDTHRKGLDVATGTVARLRADGIPSVLLNMGNSVPSSDGVMSFGIVDDATKRKLLVAADLFLLPTRYEGLPASVQEAAALRLPVATTAAAHVEWGSPGDDYLLIDPNTPEAAAATIAPALRSPERLKSLAERGYRELGSREYDQQTAEYLALFRELLNGGGAAG